MCIAGLSQLGSSSVAAFNTVIALLAESSDNIGEPQVGQNLRVTWLPLSVSTVNPLSSPVMFNASVGTPTIVEYAPPDAYWQSRQWQWPTNIGSALHT